MDFADRRDRCRRCASTTSCNTRARAISSPARTGRSIYILDDAAAFGQLTPDVLDSPLHLFDLPDAKPRLYLPYGGLWGDNLFVTQNPAAGARITYWLREYTGEPVSITIKDASGAEIRKLDGPTRPGFNRVAWDLQREPHDRIFHPDTRLRQLQFVPAGEYSVTIQSGKNSATKTLKVLPAPGEND